MGPSTMPISGVGSTLSVTVEDDSFIDELCGYETTSDDVELPWCVVDDGEIMTLVVVNSIVREIKYTYM